MQEEVNQKVISLSIQGVKITASVLKAAICTNKAADELVDESLVVPDSVTSGESIKNVSQEAEEQYNKNWTEFKAACD